MHFTLPFTETPPTTPGIYLWAPENQHVFCKHIEPRFDGQMIGRGILEPVATHLTPVALMGGLWFGPISDPMTDYDNSKAIHSTPSKSSE